MSTCLICSCEKEKSEIIQLRCQHKFCWICINRYLQGNLRAKIKCPVMNCSDFIRDKHIRSVLCEDDIIKYEKACLENTEKCHKCLLNGCPGSIFYTDPDIQYGCTICTLYNCIKCQASHNFVTCSEYKGMNPNQQQRICQDEIGRASLELRRVKGIASRDQLMTYENQDLLSNSRVFECPFCTLSLGKGEGVQLRNCSHNICKSCLYEHIKGAIKLPVMCPESRCGSIITDAEVQNILSPDELQIYLTKYNDLSKKEIKKYLHCQTPDCKSFYECSEEPQTFICKSCNQTNCVKCRTVHYKENCKDYQKRMAGDITTQSIQRKIAEGTLMKCIACNALLEKVRGCNWVQCKKCSLELCWILKIPRWGPKGRGDISGGCKCGVNGKRCDPKCTTSCTPHRS